MKYKTIHDTVEIKQDLKDTDGNLWYTLNFDGVNINVPFKPTQEHLYCFKSAIFAERERIWDECEDVGQDNRMRTLLKMDSNNGE